jgi:hypothetical protein
LSSCWPIPFPCLPRNRHVKTNVISKLSHGLHVTTVGYITRVHMFSQLCSFEHINFQTGYLLSAVHSIIERQSTVNGEALICMGTPVSCHPQDRCLRAAPINSCPTYCGYPHMQLTIMRKRRSDSLRFFMGYKALRNISIFGCHKSETRALESL